MYNKFFKDTYLYKILVLQISKISTVLIYLPNNNTDSINLNVD